jgi:hypothetical protein
VDFSKPTFTIALFLILAPIQSSHAQQYTLRTSDARYYLQQLDVTTAREFSDQSRPAGRAIRRLNSYDPRFPAPSYNPNSDIEVVRSFLTSVIGWISREISDSETANLIELLLRARFLQLSTPTQEIRYLGNLTVDVIKSLPTAKPEIPIILCFKIGAEIRLATAKNLSWRGQPALLARLYIATAPDTDQFGLLDGASLRSEFWKLLTSRVPEEEARNFRTMVEKSGRSQFSLDDFDIRKDALDVRELLNRVAREAQRESSELMSKETRPTGLQDLRETRTPEGLREELFLRRAGTRGKPGR